MSNMTNGFKLQTTSRMDMPSLNRFLVVFAFCLSVCGGYLVIIPQNKVSTTGESIQLDCTTNDTGMAVGWYDFTSSIREVSSNGKNYYPRLFTIVGEPPSYNLQINQVEISSAGRYTCSQGRQYENAELIVLENEPVCKSNVSADGISVEGDYLEFTCDLSYSSSPKWIPSMEWTGPPLFNFTGNSTETSQRGPKSMGSFNSSVVIKVTSDLDGAMIKCLTHFRAPSNLDAGYVTNDPSYSHLWYSPPLNVQLPPRDVTICPEERAYLPGSTITCFATSKPLSSYQWVNLDTNQTHIGASLVVPRYQEEGSNEYRFQCLATNVIKQIEHYGKSNYLVINVVTDDKPRNNLVFILGGSLAIALIALFLVVSAFIGYCRRVRKKAVPRHYRGNRNNRT